MLGRHWIGGGEGGNQGCTNKNAMNTLAARGLEETRSELFCGGNGTENTARRVSSQQL